VVPGDRVAVHGCGGVGLAAVMIAVAAGARVVAVDVSPAALHAAATLGAEALVDGREPDVAGAVRAASGGGVDVSLDALGSPETCRNSILGLRKRGRHVQVGLLLGPEAQPAIPMDRVLSWELEVVGSHGMAARDYPVMLARVVAGELDPGRLVGRTIPLEEAPEALAAMSRPATAAGMTVIRPG
jgi:alcohol dehydrogenase